MKVTLRIIILMVQVDTPGLIRESIMANGDITQCTVMVFSPGLMAEFILVTILMTKSMASGNLCGQMEKFTKDNGAMGNNMARDSLKHPMKQKCVKENGKKDGVLVG